MNMSPERIDEMNERNDTFCDLISELMAMHKANPYNSVYQNLVEAFKFSGGFEKGRYLKDQTNSDLLDSLTMYQRKLDGDRR